METPKREGRSFALSRRRPIEDVANSDESIFHTFVTTHALSTASGRSKVDVIGIPHAPAWHDLDELTSKNVSDLLRSRSTIAVEHVGPGFIPKKFLKRAVGLEPRAVTTYMWRAMYGVQTRRQVRADKADAMRHNARERRGYASAVAGGRFTGKIVRGEHPRLRTGPFERLTHLERISKAFAQGQALSEEGKTQLAGLVVGLRSFLMAGRVFELAKKHNDLQVIVGVGHSGHVARYLERPGLFRAYGRKALAHLEQAPKDLRFLKRYVKEALSHAP